MLRKLIFISIVVLSCSSLVIGDLTISKLSENNYPIRLVYAKDSATIRLVKNPIPFSILNETNKIEKFSHWKCKYSRDFKGLTGNLYSIDNELLNRIEFGKETIIEPKSSFDFVMYMVYLAPKDSAYTGLMNDLRDRSKKPNFQLDTIFKENDEVLDIELEMTLNRAKEMGLEAVDQYVRNYGHRTKYSILETDTKIVENVLKGRYKNFDDLNKAVTSSYGNLEEFAYILYKAIESSNLDKKNKYVIDSIYV